MGIKHTTMSTTFAIIYEDEQIPVYHRHGIGKGRVQFNQITDTLPTEIINRLPDNTRVKAIDNSQQGIETLGDIRDYIKSQWHCIGLVNQLSNQSQKADKQAGWKVTVVISVHAIQ